MKLIILCSVITIVAGCGDPNCDTVTNHYRDIDPHSIRYNNNSSIPSK